MSNIMRNVGSIRERVANAARKAGRNPDEVSIIAVTKTRTLAEIRAVMEAGLTHLGENRVQELLPKWEALGEGPTWHLVGSLQTNKVKQAVSAAHLIHSLDRESLALALAKEGVRLGRPIQALVQVNVSGEDSKHGISPDQLPTFVQQVNRLESVQIAGLMTMAPFVEDPELTRPIFRRLRHLASDLEKMQLPRVEMRWLSMGMSGDFEVAIEEGANLVRIGTALFGDR